MIWTKTNAVLNDYGEFVKKRLQDKLWEGGHKATGDLGGTLDYIVTTTDDEVSVVLVHQDYLKYIEGGIKPATGAKYESPGWKAYPHIMGWLEVKFSVHPEDLKRQTFLTTRSLFVGTDKKPATGIEPDPVLEETVKEAKEQYLERIYDAMREDVRAEIERMLEGGIW